MHEMHTIVTNVCSVCRSVRPSVCHVAELGFTVWKSFGAKLLWPFVRFRSLYGLLYISFQYDRIP